MIHLHSTSGLSKNLVPNLALHIFSNMKLSCLNRVIRGPDGKRPSSERKQTKRKNVIPLSCFSRVKRAPHTTQRPLSDETILAKISAKMAALAASQAATRAKWCLVEIDWTFTSEDIPTNTWKDISVKDMVNHFLVTLNDQWACSNKFKMYRCITKSQYLNYFKDMVNQDEILSIWNAFDPNKIGYTGAIELVLGLSSRCLADTKLMRLRTAFKVMDFEDTEYVSDEWFEIYFESIYKVMFACNFTEHEKLGFVTPEGLSKTVVKSWMREYPWYPEKIAFSDYLRFLKLDLCCEVCGKKQDLNMLARDDAEGFKNGSGCEANLYTCPECWDCKYL